MRRELIAMLPRLKRFTDVLVGDKKEGRALLRRALLRMLNDRLRYQRDIPFDRWAFAEIYQLWLGELRHKHVVNVSAVEGQFYRSTKTDKHPHTNMAKAALNMMTRTSAPDFVKDGIHMNAVDTGWVTDEDPAAHAARKANLGFAPPLDIIDGAARIVDPIFSGHLSGEHVWGQFLKDYKPAPW